GTIAGAVVGFRPPRDPSVVFVWQVGVSPDYRGRGLASDLLAAFAGAHVDDGVRFLEATVTPSNTASQRTFRGFARDCGAPCEERLLFPSSSFPGADHEEEHLFRIGPYAPEALACLRKRAPQQSPGDIAYENHQPA